MVGNNLCKFKLEIIYLQFKAFQSMVIFENLFFLITCFNNLKITYFLGPYGYSNPLNPLSPMKLMQSSYVMRSITKRTTLSNGTELLLTQYGPDVSSS